MPRRKKPTGDTLVTETGVVYAGPRFRFIGDPRHDGDGPDVLRAHGYAFPKGEAVEVTDEAVAARLAKSSHFERA
jgi:hypothetical protein